MIQSPVSRESVVRDWRSGSTRTAAGRVETRLELACTWGTGHLVVTAADRQDARDLIERVLRRIDTLGAVRARAADTDSDSALDGLFGLADGSGAVPPTRRERRDALVRLVERARMMRRSVFILVEDSDEATIDQLERLCASVEVTPEALERLRLVLVGGPALAGKLEGRAGRVLRTRTAGHIRVDSIDYALTNDFDPTAAPALGWPFALAAGVSFALIAYGAAHAVFPSERPSGASAVHVARAETSLSVPAAVAAPKYVPEGIRGDEPFLRDSLRIPLHPKWRTGSALFPPPPARVVVAEVPPAAEDPAARSSIAALMARFH